MIVDHDKAVDVVHKVFIANPHLWKNRWIRDKDFLRLLAEGVVENLGIKKKI